MDSNDLKIESVDMWGQGIPLLSPYGTATVGKEVACTHTLGNASDLVSLLHNDKILVANVFTANGSQAMIATSLQTENIF